MLLNRRALDRAIRAKYAAIPWLGPEQHSAGLAFIEKLAGIRRHSFRFGMPTVWAGERRFENDAAHFSFPLMVEGYPAAWVASVILSAVVRVSSNCTVAVLLA